ncbi:Rieske 2Fe-2S domain-containing protein [Paracoccus sp. M683]|uniref:Rieske (2Fe-2S) protein n=1 Tax=Paracoccus sp. M683 TaxID=2594268 RepID=UPI00117F3EF3|nr:Rieske 2Fe-2S domain-containing protein [Paracoccus sp. M683]TRW98174.1 Rieske 2Fe-2S domain-containing protein [Paracoccus sp. M683]
MAWTDYSTAPDPGTPVTRLDDLQGAMTLLLSTEKGEFPLLLVRAGDAVHGYVNACPHQYLPLDYRGPQILSADGARLMCTGHGAQFDAATGDPIEGADCALDRVPLTLSGDMIHIGHES